jgi:peptidoglycan/LPS O-acetylase OafA/YrhL
VQDYNAPTHELQFYGPLSHADSLMWGAVLALAIIRFGHHRWVPRAAMILGPLGLLGLALMFVYGAGSPLINTVDQAGFGQTAIVATVCLFWVVVAPRTWFARAMAFRPIAFVGKLSYSIYLWNLLAIAVFVAIVGVKPAFTKWGVVFVAALLLVSYASWRYVETPLRKRWAGPGAGSRRKITATVPE